ncbi:hypothetical protein PPERSA_01814 [Pseudocohnilembus persalinus]|uniref:Uncharacterized protein n=1 Tax=Pseudocohnilembus persalinus TaxID=266149 RepID=A0A0V0QK75_PSEPJ|nr:hypothetical protein PPERSA_01814 [Pseudocohnilembus persalinus]|eukprot:KRX02697.1 hypothetical protein PPERSA_01814 [Pseudocohnilembus persalinus]
MSNFNIIDLIENDNIDPETLDLKLQNVIQTSNNKILSLNQKKEQIDKILGSSEQDQVENNFENKIQEILSQEQIKIYEEFRQTFLQTDPEYSQNQQQQQQIQQNFEKQILKKESGNQIQDTKNKNKIQNYLKKINNTLSSILSIKPEIFEDNKLIIQGYKQILGELMDLIENNQQLLLLFSNLNLQKKESDDQKQLIQNEDFSNNQEDNIENTQNLDCHQSQQELELNFENYQIIFDQYFKFEKKSLKFIQKLLEIENEGNIIKINGFFNEIQKKIQQKLQEREIYSHPELQPFLKDMEKQLMEIFKEFTTFNVEKNQFQFAHFASNINSLLQENYFQEKSYSYITKIYKSIRR